MKRWNIGWGITSECNFECDFCYSKYTREKAFDLKYEDWINFIDNNNNKINAINFGTGENTLNDDWYKLIIYIRNKYPNIKQSLTTNGSLIQKIENDKYLYDIILKSIDEIDVSLDFCDKEKYNRFRNHEQAYKWANNTLLFCKEKNIKSTIVFVGCKATFDKKNIDGLFDIAKIYNSIIRMNIFRPMEGINEFYQKYILEPNDIIELLYYVFEKYEIISIGDSLFSAILSDSFYEDPSGISSLRILPNGNITPSTYLISQDYVVGNIKKNTLHELEKNKKVETIISPIIPHECSNCIYIARCKGGVYDRRYLWYGTLEKKDPYCFIKKNEIYKKIIVHDSDFESIHLNYLPTIFFRNPKINLESLKELA